MKRRLFTLCLLPWLAAAPAALAQKKPVYKQQFECFTRIQSYEGGWSAGQPGLIVHTVLDSQRLGRHKRLVTLERHTVFESKERANQAIWTELLPPPLADTLRIRISIAGASQPRIQHILDTAHAAVAAGTGDEPPPMSAALDMQRLEGTIDHDVGPGPEEFQFLNFPLPLSVGKPVAQGQAKHVALHYEEGFRVFTFLSAVTLFTPRHEQRVRQAMKERARLLEKWRKGLCSQ